jgi:hypothetical protein
MLLVLWDFIKTHLFYWILGAVALFAFHAWLQEHDARLQAQTQIKQSEEVVTDLRSQIASRKEQTDQQKQVIIREVHDAATPAQQIELIPKLAEVPLNPVRLDDQKVQVDIQPLVEQLGKCKEDAIELGACRQDTINLDAIVFEKEREIKALHNKPGFWHRLASDAKKVGIGMAVGAGLILVERGIH